MQREYCRYKSVGVPYILGLLHVRDGRKRGKNRQKKNTLNSQLRDRKKKKKREKKGNQKHIIY
jgi:hypothetical protein